MGKYDRLINQILSGRANHNINFKDMCGLLLNLGFSEKVKGSHHIFYTTGIEEILNLQPIGSKAKPYQVKQVRNMIVKYQLGDKRE